MTPGDPIELYREFDLSIPAGISFTHIPLTVSFVADEAIKLDSIGDIFDALGGTTDVKFLITYDTTAGIWRSYLGDQSRNTVNDATITDDIGIITVMNRDVTLNLKGYAWGTNENTGTIHLRPGANLVGVPLDDERINRVSDLLALEGVKDNVKSIVVSDVTTGEFKVVARPGDDGDTRITGGQSFFMTAITDSEVEVSGNAWKNASDESLGDDFMYAPSITRLGLKAEQATPVLVVQGRVIDEMKGQAQNGFHLNIQNLSTGASVRTVSGRDAATGNYLATLVDAVSVRAAKVGDVLEISVHTASPLIDVQPLRHTVTTDDVKRSRIHLADLVAYQIPTQTQLLPNYPNPFNPETWMPYRLAEAASVTLTIYDATGHLVRSIDVGHKPAAVYESRSKAIYWDGRNDFGEQVASGLYFYTLTANDFSATRKMLILK